MEGFDHNHLQTTNAAAGLADPSINSASPLSTSRSSQGTSVQDSQLAQALNQSLAADDHDHAGSGGSSQPEFHIALDQVASARGLDGKKVARETSFRDDLSGKGDVLDPKGGNNTVIASGDSDIIRGTGRGFNTITTGTGKDTIVLGKETTNRIFDFDPANDRFVLAGINPKDIIIAQGQNPGKAGLNQPLDSANNTLIIDKNSQHILASLTFVKSSDLSERNFAKLANNADNVFQDLKDAGLKTQRGDGKLTGTLGRDRLIGGGGDDFLYVGDNGVSFKTARGIDEFPFPTDSPGTSALNISLKNGVMRVNGTYSNFDGLPLFSQGETTIDPKAKILNGANPQALVEGFLKVSQDVEGNPLSGTHLHFSPAGDSRGNFADATVVRFFENTPIDAKSGKIKGEFELTPQEQAALLAGNLYVNIHTNIDGDGDGRAGFPTGENRININRDVVKFA